MKPTTRDAYRLLHEGSVALSHVESNGMRVDVDRLDETIEEVGERIKTETEELKRDDVWKAWRKRYGTKAQLGSRMQLGRVIFEDLEHGKPGKERTKTGRTKVDAGALEKVDLPFVRSYLEIEKLKKLHSTYLKGLRRELVNGIVRPFFNLHLVRTFRSSCDSPNLQNVPVRDEEISRYIRSCFVPRDGNVLVEIDFGALEVRIAACYNRDPVLIDYINDPSKDMHRDMAAECYRLRPDEVNKDVRFYAKNQFVFPEFYGSYYVECAKNLWDAMGRGDLKTEVLEDEECRYCGSSCRGISCSSCGGEQDRSLRTHLRHKGITDYEEFEEHIREVERGFWEDRFSIYARWKVDWHRKYQRRGWFPLLTGFRESGLYGRNDVINHPVQGVAFHCLLWCLIRIVKWTRRRRMGAMVVGQIHDSIIADVPRSELGDFVAKAVEVMTKDIREYWSWIIVPLEVDVEVGESNWHEKKAVEM